MLHILGRREDGYHELQTIFQFLDYGDELTFAVRDDGVIQLHTEFDGVPHDSNLIVKAAKKLQEQSGCPLGIDIWIEKILPMGGGIGGGSSNAATTLLGLNHLWQLGWDHDRLAALGLTLGADVPVFVRGHAAFAEGVGEKLTPVDPEEPCAKVVADMLTVVGIDRVLTVDLHADQIQGFFDIPVDNIYGSPVLVDDIEDQRFENLMIVSPDIGGVVRARAVAKSLGVDLGIIDKRREKANHSEVMHIIGDVEGRTCILVDDMVDTAGTLCHAAKALKEHGAAKVFAYCTHPVLSGRAIENIENSMLDELVVTNTIPLSAAAQACSRIRQLDIAPVVAEAVRRISNEESISAMFR
eukprot:gene3885-6025_t